MLEQLGKLNMELTQAKESCTKINKELSPLTADLEAARAQNDTLKSENSDLLSKQQKLTDQAKNANQAATVYKNENITLKTQVNQLQTGGSGPLSGTDRYVLEQEICDMTAQKETLQKALDEWTALAKVNPPRLAIITSLTIPQRSYNEYKAILPTFQEAEKLRKLVIQKDEQIQALMLELSSAKTAPKTNGVATGDVAYWKGKYEKLMASISD